MPAIRFLTAAQAGAPTITRGVKNVSSSLCQTRSTGELSTTAGNVSGSSSVRCRSPGWRIVKSVGRKMFGLGKCSSAAIGDLAHAAVSCGENFRMPYCVPYHASLSVASGATDCDTTVSTAVSTVSCAMQRLMSCASNVPYTKPCASTSGSG